MGGPPKAEGEFAPGSQVGRAARLVAGGVDEDAAAGRRLGEERVADGRVVESDRRRVERAAAAQLCPAGAQERPRRAARAVDRLARPREEVADGVELRPEARRDGSVEPRADAGREVPAPAAAERAEHRPQEEEAVGLALRHDLLVFAVVPPVVRRGDVLVEVRLRRRVAVPAVDAGRGGAGRAGGENVAAVSAAVREEAVGAGAVVGREERARVGDDLGRARVDVVAVELRGAVRDDDRARPERADARRDGAERWRQTAVEPEAGGRVAVARAHLVEQRRGRGGEARGVAGDVGRDVRAGLRVVPVVRVAGQVEHRHDARGAAFGEERADPVPARAVEEFGPLRRVEDRVPRARVADREDRVARAGVRRRRGHVPRDQARFRRGGFERLGRRERERFEGVVRRAPAAGERPVVEEQPEPPRQIPAGQAVEARRVRGGTAGGAHGRRHLMRTIVGASSSFHQVTYCV